jgi:endo-1,4-beta-xylanase
MFPDAAGAWFEEHAVHMAEHGFMAGFADGSFGGDRPITRGQFAAVMAKMMEIAPALDAPFSDTSGFWGAGFVGAMARMGVVKGHEDGTFGPYETITRAQMAAMMDRAWTALHDEDGLTQQEMEQLRAEMLQHMPDTAGHWAEDHVARMYGLGVMQGDGQGHFNPDHVANRAQASAMMWRWYEASTP